MKVPRSTRSTAYGRGAGVSWDWARARLSGPYKLKLTTNAPLPLRICLREMDFVSTLIFDLLSLSLHSPISRRPFDRTNHKERQHKRSRCGVADTFGSLMLDHCTTFCRDLRLARCGCPSGR